MSNLLVLFWSYRSSTEYSFPSTRNFTMQEPESIDLDDSKWNVNALEQPDGVFHLWIFSIRFFYTLVIGAAQDILAGTFIPTCLVLMVNIGPQFLVCLISPYFMQKIPYFARITAFCLSNISGCLLLSLAKQVHWKLIGVG